jgi:HK97 family phage major capsid protein
LGQLLIDSDQFRGIGSGFRGQTQISFPNMERADITSADTTVGAGRSLGTSLVPGARVPGIVTPYQRELRLRDVINVGQTVSNSVEWPRETGYTNNSRPVTETTTIPKSELTFDLVTAPVRTISHIFKLSLQILDDAPGLASYINARGTYGLGLTEESQILSGNGTNQNLNGILPQSTDFSPQFTVDNETAIDRILEAVSQAEDAEIPVNAVVLNKRNWRKITAVKSTTAEYISDQSPFGLTDPRLWGVTVIPTNAMPAGTFLAGAFQAGATIFDRMGVEVLLSTENSDDFERGMCTVRIQSRLALAVFRPEAFVSGDLTAST